MWFWPDCWKLTEHGDLEWKIKDLELKILCYGPMFLFSSEIMCAFALFEKRLKKWGFESLVCDQRFKCLEIWRNTVTLCGVFWRKTWHENEFLGLKFVSCDSGIFPKSRKIENLQSYSVSSQIYFVGIEAKMVTLVMTENS